MRPVENEPPIDDAALLTFFRDYLPANVPARLAERRDLDIGVSLAETERYRLNLYYQTGRLSAVARRVPSGALSFEALRLPASLRDLAERPRGLVLITGPTGSGKSSTMAAMLHHLNATVERHVVTIEDPIEFIHQDVKSVISQREIGNDTTSFSSALRHVVRQSPDAIFIGEMRDLETIQTAISAAMTGHLVVATMHTIDVLQTVERIINYFPDHLREQMSVDLALALSGIVSQRLVPRGDGEGMVPVFEVLTATPLTRRVISNRQLEDLTDILKAGEDDGMTTFTRSLVSAYKDGLISEEAGSMAATNKDEFLLAIQGMETGIDTLRRGSVEEGAGKSTMRELLRAAVRHGASDLTITATKPPILRIDGGLRELNMPVLQASDTRRLLFSVLSPAQRARFESEKELDLALSVTGIKEGSGGAEGQLHDHRFRVNAYFQKGTIAVAVRVIAERIPDAAELGLPQVLVDLARREHGLILITGPTGHGKSTTLACLIDRINATRACHVVTVEDPIEYVHRNRRAVVDQREIGSDTQSFSQALKYVLRQDPDVILIGEMRDAETIAAALTAAETGHLVLATLHTNDAVQSIDRIIDSFPSHQQNQVRAQLAASLVGVVAQRLIPRLDGNGRVACFEIMLGTTPIRSLIRDARTHQMASVMETQAKDGMITMDKALANLFQKKLIGAEAVKSISRDPNITAVGSAE